MLLGITRSLRRRLRISRITLLFVSLFPTSGNLNRANKTLTQSKQIRLWLPLQLSNLLEVLATVTKPIFASWPEENNIGTL
jgi:hypothetical protein